MNTKHYIDGDGAYIGGFGDGAEPPVGAIEVDKAPSHGSDIWVGNKFEPDPIYAAEKEKKTKKKAAEVALLSALSRIILNEALTQKDIDSATDYLGL